MFWHYYLRVAGVTILLESDRAIMENEAFLPFLTEEAAPGLHAVIRKGDALPCLPEAPLYEDTFCAVAKNDAGHLQKFFFGSSRKPTDCVVSTCDPDGRHILIEYPATDAYAQLTLNSCFYWLGFEAHLLQRSSLCLHAACVDTPFGGLLFSGVSGIGKSTQAELWCSHGGGRQINGDRPILSKADGSWKAWGSPYAGSSKCYRNESCDVSAILLLKQATQCSLRRLTPAEAFRGVWAGLTIRSWDPAFVDAASLLTIDLVTAVPVYEFRCTPDEQAVECLVAELRKGCSL